MSRFAPFLLLVFAAAALAAGIDGKWVAEMKAGGKKKAEAAAAQVTLDLKSEGNQLTGTVSAPGRKRASTLAIKDGKIEGNRFSFTTVQQTRKGENKMQWQGTLEGDQLKGTRGKEGGKRGAPFTAKRQ